MNNSLISTNAQKVLDFLIQNPGKQFLANDIQKSTKISRAGVNFALRQLAKEKLILREKKAKIYLYAVDHYNQIIKQLKVLRITILLQPLINKLKTFVKKIVLFGSCAQGEDIPESDIDLFIMTNNSEKVREILETYNVKKKIQAIIRTSLQFVEMGKKEPVFFEEINRGITFWEERE